MLFTGLCCTETNTKSSLSFVFFLVCLRIQINPQNKGEFLSISPERAFADFLFAHTVLHLVVMNFIGWNVHLTHSVPLSEGVYFTPAFVIVRVLKVGFLKIPFWFRIPLSQSSLPQWRYSHLVFPFVNVLTHPTPTHHIILCSQFSFTG